MKLCLVINCYFNYKYNTMLFLLQNNTAGPITLKLVPGELGSDMYKECKVSYVKSRHASIFPMLNISYE